MTDNTSAGGIDALQWENRRFPPSEEFKRQTLVAGPFMYDEAATDDQGFWARPGRRSARLVDRVVDRSASGICRSPSGSSAAQLNVSHNCLDRHVLAGRGDKVAFYWEGEPGDSRVVTYADLLDETQRFANVLKGLGVGKGDRVNIYLPMIPEAAVAMLACARIGAAHSVVFGGFSANSLRDRINDAEAKVLITADGGYRRGDILPLKPVADEALADTPTHHRRRRRASRRQRRRRWSTAVITGTTSWSPTPTRCAPPSRWTPSNCCSCCTPRAPRASRRASCTRAAAT